MTSIGEAAFGGCSGLTSIKVKSGNTKYDSRDNCNAIIETASNTLISGCQNTTIPNNVTSIGKSAFFACSSLTSITIPNSVTSIGDAAFQSCSGLTSVTIGNGVTSIGEWAFSRCSGLTSITILGSVTNIGEGAFFNCSGLLDMYCYAENVPTTRSNVFNSSNIANATLHVPQASVNAYQTTVPWNSFGTIVPLVIPGSTETVKMAVASGDRTAIGYSSSHGLDFTNVTDVKAWIVSGFTDDATVLLSRVKIVPPNTGLYLTSDVAGIEVDVPTTDKDIYYANLLKAAVTEETIQPTEMIGGVEYTNFVVGKLTNGDMGFVRVTAERTLGPNKSRLLVPSSYYPVNAPSLSVEFIDETTTDIKDFEAEHQQPTGHVFDLQGRKLSVDQARKGMYIYKGKKYFIK